MGTQPSLLPPSMTANKKPVIVISGPDIGDPSAPIGSRGWAAFWRTNLQGHVKDVQWHPDFLRESYERGIKHRAWTLLEDRSGNKFSTWDKFCSEPVPWGLGIEPEKFKAFIEAKFGKEAAQLETVAPAQPDVHGKDGRFSPSRHDGGSDKPKRSDERLRAITRAPEPVQDMYRNGVIGQIVAAKLGPEKPEPWQSARITKIANAIADTPVPETKREREKIKREVNAKVLEMLEQPRQTPEARVAATVSKSTDLPALANKLVEKVPRDKLRELVSLLQERLGK